MNGLYTGPDRLPSTHRARTHSALRDGLFRAAKTQFAEHPGTGLWDPTRSGDEAIDLGRGFLDAFALALHVLWTYQEAWAEEGFLATARLAASADRLLSRIAYRPSPGAAAQGLQHFRCKVGVPATLPIGFGLRSPGRGEEPSAVFETLESIRIYPELNEIRVLRSAVEAAAAQAEADAAAGSAGSAGSDGPDGSAGAAAPTLGEPPSATSGEPTVPLPGQSIIDALRDRLTVQRNGPLHARKAARAANRARRLAGLAQTLGPDPDPSLQGAIDAICAQLCEAQSLAAEAANPASAEADRSPGPLSETQELLDRQLRRLHTQQSLAVDALEEALACGGDELEADFARRLDRMVTFLDAFVGELLVEARDQVVRLRGPDALSTLDRSLAGATSAPALGKAPPGTDTLYLIGPDGGPLPMVRPGDRFVIAEDVETIDLAGNARTERVFREAIRVLTVREQTPPERSTALTRVTFEPRLARRYRLDDVVFLGNIARISEGESGEEIGAPSLDRRVIPLGRRALTWLRDSNAADGRRPQVEMTVDGREWTRVDSLVGADPHAPVFAVEARPDAGAQVRVGDGIAGASLSDNASIRLKYRVGLGRFGNRDRRRISDVARAHPSIEETFNPLPLAGGADAEPDDEARIRGPLSIRALDHAVSVEDVRALALQFDGVERARVFRDPVRARERLTVVVSGLDAAALPDADLELLRQHLAARVAPGITVALQNRQPVEVRAAVVLRIDPTADPIEIIRRARESLGIDRDPSGEGELGLLDPAQVDIGADLPLSAVYGALDGIDGLESVVVSALYRVDDAPGLVDGVIADPREQLVWATPTDEVPDGVALSYEEARDR